jgi:hypothetical protein
LRDRQLVEFLAGEDRNASQIASLSGIPRATVRDWLTEPAAPRKVRPSEIDLNALPGAQYSYLLGFYLGDGTVSRHGKGVYRLRIVTDKRYPKIIAECVAAMQAVLPNNRVHVQQLPYRAVEIGCYSKAWPLLFPQLGPGLKHRRKIELEPWQAEIVDRYTREFLRGLIHADGCRVLNRVNGKDYPRYFFDQVSDDIRRLFCEACAHLGIEYTWSRWKTVSIARSESVAMLDEFVGPKE